MKFEFSKDWIRDSGTETIYPNIKENNLFKVTYKGKEGYVITDDNIKTDGYYYNSFDKEIRLYSIKVHSYHHKIIASTFPLGDLPQFVIQNKNSEDELEAVVKEYIGMNPNKEWDNNEDYYNPKNREYYSFKDGWNKHAEKYKFTEEDVKKAIQLAREADSIDGVVDLPIVLNYPNADNSDLQIKWTEEEIIQSLQKPKEITEIEFEMEINQCDGCRAGYPIKNKIHQVPYPNGSMVCKADMYNKINIRITTDFPNGLLTIKNVKYG